MAHQDKSCRREY